MENHGYQHYREQQGQNILEMGQNELLLLLYDELVKQLTRCDLAITHQNFALLDDSADRSLAILRYLDDTLDLQYEIGRELHRLYDFFSYEMNRVKMGRNKAELDKIRPMLTDLRDTFRAADKNCAEGRGGPAGTPEQQPAEG